MSNPNLEVTGVQFVIDDKQSKEATERIAQQLALLEKRGPEALKRAGEAFDVVAKKFGLIYNARNNAFIDEQGRKFQTYAQASFHVTEVLRESEVALKGVVEETKNLGEVQEEAGEKAEKGFTASRYSLRFFASEMVQATGVGGQFGSIIGRVVTAMGPLDVILIAITGALVAFQQEAAKQQASFENEIQTIARLSATYETYRIAREKALDANPLIRFQEELKKSFDQDLAPGPRHRSLQEYDQYIKAIGEKSRQLGEGYLALGRLAQERIGAQWDSVRAAAEEGAAAERLATMILEVWKAEGFVTEETLKSADAMALLGVQLEIAARAHQVAGAAASEHKRALESLARVDLSVLQTDRANRAADSALNAEIGRGLLQLQDLQQSFRESSEQLEQQHQDRMADITEQGNARRADIYEGYVDRLVDIERNLAQARLDAASQFTERLVEIEEQAQERRAALAESYAERLAQLEVDAQERRTQLLESLAERRANIERQYQETIRRIQMSYEDSIFEAEANRDAKSIVAARRTRARQLQEAERQRAQAHTDATRDYEKQRAELEAALLKQKQTLQRDYQRQLQDLEKALAKQRAELKKDYDKRLRDLAEAARRQQVEAARQYQRQLRDLIEALAKQRHAESNSYGQQRLAQKNAYDQRLTALGKALAAEGKLTDEYVKRVTDAFKKILNPAEYAIFIKALQDAFNAQINVRIFSNAPLTPPQVPPPGSPPGPFAKGGFVGGTAPMQALLHPPELVLPLNNMARTQQLLADYLAPRMAASNVLGGRGGSSRVDVYVHPELNEGILSVKVRAIADDQMVRVFTEAHERTGAMRR